MWHYRMGIMHYIQFYLQTFNIIKPIRLESKKNGEDWKYIVAKIQINMKLTKLNKKLTHIL